MLTSVSQSIKIQIEHTASFKVFVFVKLWQTLWESDHDLAVL